MHTDWSLFFGRFHPLLVHLPIGIIIFAVALTIVGAYKKSPFLSSAIDIAFLASFLSAAIAVASGLFLSSAGGYNEKTLFWHKWIGITVAIVILIAWLVRRRAAKDFNFLGINFSSWLLYSSCILISIGGHLGGNMTHGEGYLTKYMPSYLKAIFVSNEKSIQSKPIPILDSVVVFSDIIHPIFTEKCASCHNPDKQKGELDLTTIDAIKKGGKSGNTVVSGDIDKSELYHRITLPHESNKFMPADNRPALTPIEVGFIKRWIESGADYNKNITALQVDEKTKYLIGAYLGIDAENNLDIKLPIVPSADSAVLAALKDMKIIVRSVTSKSNLLDVSFVMVQRSSSQQILMMLQKLVSIKQQLYRLDVSNCNLTIDDIKIIAGFDQLVKLQIQKNNLTDDLMEPLGTLQHLATLNAGQNNLTDKSISTFKKMSSLKKINLWQTQVTEQGSKDLQSQLKGLDVDR